MPRTESEILNDLNISTRAFLRDTVMAINHDNFFSSRLLKRSQPFPGGDKVEQPLEYGEETVETLGEYGQYDFQPEDLLDRADYNIKHINGTMTMSELRMVIQNKGKAADIKLAMIKSKNLSRTMKKKFSSLLFTPVADLGDNDPDSLIKIVATRNNTVGGINAATTTEFNWNPFLLDYTAVDPSYANLVDPTSDYYIEKILRNLVGPLTIDKDAPTIGLTNQVIWDAYEEVLRADKRFDSRYDVDGGFETLRFRRMKIAVDANVPGGKLNTVSDSEGMLMAINEEYIGYQHSPAANFKWTPWKKLEQQPVYASLLDWYGTLWCSRRDRHGAVLGLPTENQVYGTP